MYCTSWTFYGTVGQASNNPWSFLPSTFAPILVFSVGVADLARSDLIAKREHDTSIATLSRLAMANQGLAVAVTVIAAVVGGSSLYRATTACGITMGLEIVARPGSCGRLISGIITSLGLWSAHWRSLRCRFLYPSYRQHGTSPWHDDGRGV